MKIENMDPWLQLALTAQNADNEVSFIANVSDINAWEQLKDVKFGTKIPNENGNDFVVTARTTGKNLLKIIQLSFVKNLEVSRQLYPQGENNDNNF